MNRLTLVSTQWLSGGEVVPRAGEYEFRPDPQEKCTPFVKIFRSGERLPAAPGRWRWVKTVSCTVMSRGSNTVEITFQWIGDIEPLRYVEAYLDDHPIKGWGPERKIRINQFPHAICAGDL